MLRSSARLTAILALALNATFVQAQSNNASDVTGAPVTSGAIIGGIFVPAGVEPAFRMASDIVRSEMSSRVTASLGGTPIPRATQNLLFGTASAVQPFTTALAGSGAPAVMVTTLANSLLGLMNSPTPQRVIAAMQAWNAVVRATSDSFLANPSPEFEATAALMQSYATALRAQAVK